MQTNQESSNFQRLALNNSVTKASTPTTIQNNSPTRIHRLGSTTSTGAKTKVRAITHKPAIPRPSPITRNNAPRKDWVRCLLSYAVRNVPEWRGLSCMIPATCLSSVARVVPFTTSSWYLRPYELAVYFQTLENTMQEKE